MASRTLYDSAEKVAGAFERVMLAALSLLGREEERTLSQLKADVFTGIILDAVTPSGVGKGIRDPECGERDRFGADADGVE